MRSQRYHQRRGQLLAALVLAALIAGLAPLLLDGTPAWAEADSAAPYPVDPAVQPGNNYLLELWDVDGNGVLDSNEFYTFSYDAFDYDGDGLLDETEWYDYTAAWFLPYGMDYGAFDYYDRDGSAAISMEEYAYSLDDADLYRYLDDDRDGYLGQAEMDYAFGAQDRYGSSYTPPAYSREERYGGGIEAPSQRGGREESFGRYYRYEDFGAF